MFPSSVAWRAVLVLTWSMLLLASAARGGEADVVGVKVQRTKEGTYQFDVTIRHADEGWQHYADLYEIVAPDGRVLATRRLQHPHVDEQPVTRSLAGVSIPPSVTRVTVRAHDSQHGFGGKELMVNVPQ